MAQWEIEESRTKYSDLYDFAPVGYLTFDKNGLISVTVISKDITKLKALSLTDKLTGLYNRRGLFALVEQLLN